MDLQDQIQKAEDLLKSLSEFEKKGLDTSSLKVFIKNLKVYNKIRKATIQSYNKKLSFEEKLNIIKSFLEDKKVFPTISDVINFANVELSLGFKDQKESRPITIRRVINRIEQSPNLKDKVKDAVMRIRNQVTQEPLIRSTKRDKDKAESFARWAEILTNL